MPCQWIEVCSRRRLVTCSVTVSPSRQRSSGAGTWPLTVVAMRAAPVNFTGVSPISRWNSVPRSSAGKAGAACRLAAAARQPPSAASAPPAANPCTKRRRAGMRKAVMTDPRRRYCTDTAPFMPAA
jgi:hypothetical protein